MDKELQEHIKSESGRLDRIEEKIDKLSDAVVSIARAEEKLAALTYEHGKMYDRMNRFSEKLDQVDETVKDNHRTIQIINKLFWVLVIAVAGGYVEYFLK